MKLQRSNYRLFIFCAGIISLVSFILPVKTQASELVIEAGVQTVYEGESFAVNWFLDTKGKEINSLDLTIGFSEKTLDLLEVSPGNSLVSLWVEKPYLKSPGKISLIGGIPGGISGSRVPVFRAVFSAKASGNAEFKISDQPKVLLNDGQGTADAFDFSPLRFLILPNQDKLVNISSPTHPNPADWYKNTNVTIVPGIGDEGEYSYSFSFNAEILPENRPQEIPKEILFNDLPDGVYYFKLHLKTGENTWQEAGVYRVQIDKTPPDFFQPNIGQDSGLYGGRDFLSFSAVDKASGIKSYEIKNGWLGQYTEATSPYEIRKPIFGNTIWVKALDFAGNSRVVAVSYPGYINNSLLAILILIILIFIVQYWYRKSLFRNKNNAKNHSQS